MLIVFRWVFGLLCIAKGVDIAARGSQSIGVWALVLGALWLLAAIALTLGFQTRIMAAALIVLSGVVTLVSHFEMYNQHLYLIASICAIFVINQAMETLLKAQLTIVYVFAAAAKINESFLSGTELYTSTVQRWFWTHFIPYDPAPSVLIPVSVFAICAEAFLAAALWFRRTRWIALVVGVGFHLGMLVLMAGGLLSVLRLAIFGFLMLALYIPFFADEVDKLYNRFVPQGMRAKHRGRKRSVVSTEKEPRRLSVAFE
jgi:hypothetical protein